MSTAAVDSRSPAEAGYFGPPERARFGWLHRPATSARVGVVIVPPFGYEAVCAARSLRHLADDAARAGLIALRFDPDGTGDSAGDDLDPARLEHWLDSIDDACALVAARAALMQAWMPWVILSVFVFIWGLPSVKAWLNGLFAPSFPMTGLHNLVEKMPPVVPRPTKEGAVYVLNLLSATGTGILLSALVSALLMKYNPVAIVRTFFKTIWLVKYSLLTIVLMLALGTLTRYSGTDTTLGLAFANTGVFYPFFGTLMGWIGVALTGSDTASNVLFGGMQKVAAEQLGLSANLMGAANSSGGVMGKMIDAQSIVVASTATRWFNHEGDILRYVFFHSIALACLVGLYVTAQAYVWPMTLMVVR